MSSGTWKALFWSPFVRIPIVAVLFLTGDIVARHLPVISEHLDFTLVRQVLSEVSRDDIENVSKPEFAYALASEIVSAALGLAFAFLVAYVGAIRFALSLCKRKLSRHNNIRDFENNFDSISQSLATNPLIGDAWIGFVNTYVREDVKDKRHYFSTVRPQAYFNVALAREHLFGLKLMPSIPGYFVGLGLLLTFVGLVIALSKAAHGTGVSAEDMTRSLRELLNAATFKFATSIAGLFSSLILSLIFRSYSILIEGGFDGFCRALERRLKTMTPQALAFKSWQAQEKQLHELQQMNTDQYFQKLGAAIAPTVGGAVRDAMSPLALKLDETVGKLEDVSKNSATGLIEQFSKVVQSGAGRELQELSGTLSQTIVALREVHVSMSGTGDAFASKISEATESFVRLVADASSKLNNANDGSRDAIDHALRALTLASEDAKRRIDQSTSKAGRVAADVMDQGMRDVLAKIGGQMESFQGTITGFQQTITRESELAAARSRETMEATAKVAGKSATDGAETIRAGFEVTLASIRAEVEHAAAFFRSTEEIMRAQAQEQMTSLQSVLAKIRADTSEEAATATSKSREAVADVVSAAARAAADTSNAIRSGLGEALSTLRTDVERMSAALSSSEAAFARQTEAARMTAEHSGVIADAFGRVADDVNRASAPLLQASESISGSTRSMSEAMRGAVDGLLSSQTAARTLAASLEQNHSKLESLWNVYADRFERVDASLAGAISTLATETTKYQAGIKEFVIAIDKDCAKAVEGLERFAASLNENTGQLGDTLEEFVAKIPVLAAAGR